jgi:hypothetical protein
MIKLKYISLFFIIISCNSERSLNFGEKINYFGVELINHFPDKIRHKGSVHAISQDITTSHPYVWLKYFPESKKLDSIQNSVKSTAIAVYDSEDNCLIVIDKHLTADNWYIYDKKIRNPKKIEYNEQDCNGEKYPVPNFYEEWIYETNKTLTKLEGYKLYVLEASKGLHMNPEKLPNGLYTPKGWEHGYSKGVAINRDKGSVIYWADIW